MTLVTVQIHAVRLQRGRERGEVSGWFLQSNRHPGLLLCRYEVCQGDQNGGGGGWWWWVRVVRWKRLLQPCCSTPLPHIGSGKEGYPRKPFETVSRSIGPFYSAFGPNRISLFQNSAQRESIQWCSSKLDTRERKDHSVQDSVIIKWYLS